MIIKGFRTMWAALFISVSVLFLQYVSEVSKVEAAKEARHSTWAYQLSKASRAGLKWSYDSIQGMFNGEAESPPTVAPVDEPEDDAPF